MSEQQGTGEVGGIVAFNELSLLKGALINRSRAEDEANALSLQAGAIRADAERQVTDTWTQTKTAIQQAAEAGELTGRDLLIAIVDFRDMSPKTVYGYHKMDREFVTQVFESAQPGEPLLGPETAGVIQAEPEVRVLDHLSALGAYIHVTVEKKPGDQVVLKLLADRELGAVIIGQANIQAHIDKLRYNSQQGTHGYRNNLEKLVRIREDLSAMQGFNFDTTKLSVQIAEGENAETSRRDQRKRSTSFQRAIKLMGH